jgi:hypothetical protein
MRSIASTARTAATSNQAAQLFDSVPGARKWLHDPLKRSLYAYKVDPRHGRVVPIILDAHNHGWDAVRYGLDGYIQRHGVNAQWERLGQ